MLEQEANKGLIEELGIREIKPIFRKYSENIQEMVNQELNKLPK